MRYLHWPALYLSCSQESVAITADGINLSGWSLAERPSGDEAEEARLKEDCEGWMTSTDKHFRRNSS